MSQDKSAPPIRWWPAVTLVALAVAAMGAVWWSGEDQRQLNVIASLGISLLVALLLVAWLLFASRLRWRLRLILVAGLIAAGVLVASLLEVRGTSGDLVPILAWKWTPKPGADISVTTQGTGAPTAGRGADFPQFLGPDRNARLRGMGLSRDWATTPPREIWRHEIGAGWSSFAVVGGRAVTQEQRDDREAVTCYDLLTGAELWSHSTTARYETVLAGIGPRATPAIAEGRIYAQGATGLLTCLDLETGAELWSRDVLADHSAANLQWGKANSPLVMGELVVVSAGGPLGHSLAAYDRLTGDPVWSGGDDPAGYSSPLVATLAGRRQIVIFNRDSVTGHDPADGSVLWRYPWPRTAETVALPVVVGPDRLLVSTGYGIGSKMLRIQAAPDGALTAELEWESPRLKAKFANFVVHDGYVYGLDDGVLVCLDPATGERRWKGGRYGHGQMLLADDLLLVTAEMGEVILIDPNPEELTELGRFRVFDRKSWNPPVLAGRYLLWRNDVEAALFELP